MVFKHLTKKNIGLKPKLYIDKSIRLMVMLMKVDLNDVEYISETSLTIRGTRRRTTVPKVIVDKLKLKNGDKIRWVFFKDDSISITKVTRRD